MTRTGHGRCTERKLARILEDSMTRCLVLMVPVLTLACQDIDNTDDTDSTSEPTVEATFAATLTPTTGQGTKSFWSPAKRSRGRATRPPMGTR